MFAMFVILTGDSWSSTSGTEPCPPLDARMQRMRARACARTRLQMAPARGVMVHGCTLTVAHGCTDAVSIQPHSWL